MDEIMKAEHDEMKRRLRAIKFDPQPHRVAEIRTLAADLCLLADTLAESDTDSHDHARRTHIVLFKENSLSLAWAIALDELERQYLASPWSKDDKIPFHFRVAEFLGDKTGLNSLAEPQDMPLIEARLLAATRRASA